MGTQPYCTDSARRLNPYLRTGCVLAPLMLLVLLVHGFFPWSEDGGLYAAGIEYKLDPQLFPTDTAFVTEPFRYSAFAGSFALLSRVTHMPLGTVLLLGYVASCGLMLWAVHRLAGALLEGETARWAATVFVASLWTVPVAGTSLLLMDPYLTARSIAVPLVTTALALLLERSTGRGGRWAGRQVPALVLAAALFHPLMAGYGALLCGAVWWESAPRRIGARVVGTAGVLGLAGLVQWGSPAESVAVRMAALSRSYWFLPGWRWFEDAGLLAPLVFFAILLWRRPRELTGAAAVCCRAGLWAGGAALATAGVFAREGLERHGVARLQPLRMFLFVYVLFLPLFGGVGWTLVQRAVRPLRRPAARHLALASVWALLATGAGLLAWAQSEAFPGAAHLPWPAWERANPWQQAFLWARWHTPRDAMFALDGLYVQAPGEGALCFRAVAERGMLADAAKDGGEASIAPDLAERWSRESAATRELGDTADGDRLTTLRQLGATWVLLDAHTPVALACPYRNAEVKICRL